MDRLQLLHTLLADQPQDPFLNHALALEEIKAGRDASARQVFEALLSRNPEYVGSYYHLGKLLERMGEESTALVVYERGMEAARRQRDDHALGELRGAYDNLI